MREEERKGKITCIFDATKLSYKDNSLAKRVEKL